MHIYIYIDVFMPTIKTELQMIHSLWGLEDPTKTINESKILPPSKTGHTYTHTHKHTHT